MKPRPPEPVATFEQVPPKLKPVPGKPGVRLVLLRELRVESHEVEHR